MNPSTPGLPVHHQLPESTQPMSIESVMPSHYLILGHPLLLLPSIFPSIRVFSNESALHIRWPKYWSFSFNISPCNEHPGLNSSRMHWLDYLAIQGTLKGPLQHHSSKASIIQHSAFFIVQLSHPYMTTGKTIALTRLTFVGKCTWTCWHERYFDNIHWITEKAREFQKNTCFGFIDYTKPFDCVDHNKLWKILKEMGIPHHLTCRLRNLYAGQEATARIRHGTTECFQIGKGVPQGCILSPWLFN